MDAKKVLVIGGGIGGMAVALLLQRAGSEAAIYEAQPAPDDAGGYFLNVASNGLQVLKTLGLEQAVAAEGFPIPRMIMWNGSGKRLGEVRNGAAPGQGEVSTVIKRGSLHRLLRAEVQRQGVAMAWGKQLIGAEVTPDAQVIARFADGTTAQGDCLIGCDGIHSRTRQIINPGAPQPAYTGLISCGGFAHSTVLAPTPNMQHFIFGKRAFFGYFVKASGEVWWFSNLAYAGEPRRSELAAIPHAAWQQKLLDLYREDQPFINDLIRATPGEIGMYPIYDVPTTPNWHQGPLVLLGDAVHAMSPSAGQGASFALEDAIVLAKCIRDFPTWPGAFTAYESLRRQRAEKMVKSSRKFGNNKAAPNAAARWLRDLMLPLILKSDANAQALDWVYKYKVDWNTAIQPALDG